MTLPSHGPDLVRRMAAMERRLAELERNRGAVHPPLHRLADAKLHDVKDGEAPVWDKTKGYWVPGTAGQVIWSHPGAVAVAIGQRHYATAARSVAFVLASVDVAGTSTTTVVVKKNTTTIATVNLASGVNVARVDLTGVTLALGANPPTTSDYLRAEVTAAGSGAQRLGVQVG